MRTSTPDSDIEMQLHIEDGQEFFRIEEDSPAARWLKTQLSVLLAHGPSRIGENMINMLESQIDLRSGNYRSDPEIWEDCLEWLKTHKGKTLVTTTGSS